MPAFIRYPLFGCVIFALSACGSSGSSRLLEPAAAPAMGGSVPEVQKEYSSVDYLLEDIQDIQDAIGKFAGNLLQVYRDAAGNKYLLTDTNVTSMNVEGVKKPTGVETIPDFADLLAVYKDEDENEYLLTPANVADMDLMGVDLPTGVDTAPDFADLTKVRDGDGTGATRLSKTPTQLDKSRDNRVLISTRYLSTGAVLARTDDGSVVDERPSYNQDGDPNPDVSPNPAATCEDASATGPAKCTFGPDSLREDGIIFHLGRTGSSDKNRVGFRSFKADREPVMSYRDAEMSQVRQLETGESALPQVYKDEAGNKYLLTSANVTGKNLDDVELPDGVTDRPEFADLFAVYKDEDDNEYLLTPANVAGMNLDEVKLPDDVTDRPAFADLTIVREGESDGYQYVGYDGMLQYSMFFVGVYRFFDDDDDLEHLRFENASLGRIYDEDSIESGIQSPSVALTGEGVMVGVERDKESLDHFLVQGDVNIEYSPEVEADTTVTPNVDAAVAMIDIEIDNIKRLVGDGEAWYAGNAYAMALTWNDLVVMDSKFSAPAPTSQVTAEPGKLSGSFYGTKSEDNDKIEVGGVFHHEGPLYEIIGSFGSKLAEPEDDDE